jgi:dienelactone hydrolase
MMLWRCFNAALLCLLAACQGPSQIATTGAIGLPEGPWREQTHLIPFKQDDGLQGVLAGRVCRPTGDAPARVVVIAHGSPPVARERLTTRLASCSSEAVSWFLSRGYMVVLSLRRGYGSTAGQYVEGAEDCSVDAYERSARISAQDLAATVSYAVSLPYARHDGVIVVGQSAGGWATVGLDSLPHPDVIAMISMAGGRGGHEHNVPNSNCHPENLAEAAGRLGQTATTPMLWVYTENDSYFAPPIARAMYQAFSTNGGHADFHAFPPYGADGHRLFFGPGGPEVWGPLVAHYLAERGAT